MLCWPRNFGLAETAAKLPLRDFEERADAVCVEALPVLAEADFDDAACLAAGFDEAAAALWEDADFAEWDLAAAMDDVPRSTEETNRAATVHRESCILNKPQVRLDRCKKYGSGSRRNL